MRVTRASDGRANLHIWREGREYWCQKSGVFLKEWTNVQFTLLPYPEGGVVNYFDVRRPLQFASDTFDAIDVYHVFEHLTPQDGKRFAGELYRVLKPRCVCRVSVPDLERICRDYLRSLEYCLKDPSPKNVYRYRWSVFEIFDQIVREKSGGKMLEALRRNDLDVEFIEERYGDVFREFYGKATPWPKDEAGSIASQSRIRRLLAGSPARIPSAIRQKAKQFLYSRFRKCKEAVFKGDPQRTRESVKWMYDRLSLRLLLEDRGFMEFAIKSHGDSDIIGWDRYDLDRSNYGDYTIDPSVYVEVKKPCAAPAGTAP